MFGQCYHKGLLSLLLSCLLNVDMYYVLHRSFRTAESPSEVGHDQLCALAKPLHFSEALFPTVPTAWESGEGPPLIGAAYTKRLVNRARACGTAYPGPRPATGPQTHNGGNLPSPSQQARTWRAGLRPQPHSDQPHVHGRWWEAPALTVVMCGLRTTEDGE